MSVLDFDERIKEVVVFTITLLLTAVAEEEYGSRILNEDGIEQYPSGEDG